MNARAKSKVKPKETVEQAMARRAKEIMAPTRDIVSRIKDWTVIMVAVTATGSFLYSVFNYGGLIWESGPLPIPSRKEVSDVATALKEAKDSQNIVNQNLTTQLENQGAITRSVLEERKREAADQLARQLSTQQSALDVAKAIYDKDPSLANQKVVEALSMRLMELQRQINTPPPK